MRISDWSSDVCSSDLGFPIRKSTDQRVLAPPRSLSQRATSFIASVRQGIHQMPLKRLIQRNLVTSRDQFSDFAKGKAANLVSRFAKGKATREALQCSQQKTPHDSQTQNVRLDFQDPARVPSSLPAHAQP